MEKGYKGMKSDMTCRGFQYEIGKEYHIDGDIKLCENGFHFCKNLKDVFIFYGRDKGNRFFEVEGNIIKSDNKKSVADKMHIIRELTTKEVNRGHYGSHTGNGYYGKITGNGNGDGYGYGYSDGNGSCYGRIRDGYGDGDNNGCIDGNGNGYGIGNNIIKILKFI